MDTIGKCYSCRQMEQHCDHCAYNSEEEAMSLTCSRVMDPELCHARGNDCKGCMYADTVLKNSDIIVVKSEVAFDSEAAYDATFKVVPTQKKDPLIDGKLRGLLDNI